MSEDSVKYRKAMKDKAHRLANQEDGRVDASDYKIPGKPTSSGQHYSKVKDNLTAPCDGKPANPREYKRGGLATGGKAAHHAGRAKRDMGGAMPPQQPGMAPGMNVPVNRFNMSPIPNKMGAAIQSATGIKKGGRVRRADGGWFDDATRKVANTLGYRTGSNKDDSSLPPEPDSDDSGKKKGGRIGRKSGGGNWIAGAIKHPGALHKELGVPEGKKIPEKKLEKAEHSKNPVERKRANLAETLKGMHKAKGGGVSDGKLEGTRPTGGRLARKHGGSTKGKTNIAIIIGGGHGHPDTPPASMTQGPARPPIPPVPPPAAMAAPMPPQAPMGGGMPPQMPPQMPMRADGGRLIKPGKYPIDSSAAGGLGRLEKAKAYGL